MMMTTQDKCTQRLKENIMECARCKASTTKTAKFCSNCGSRFKVVAQDDTNGEVKELKSDISETLLELKDSVTDTEQQMTYSDADWSNDINWLLEKLDELVPRLKRQHHSLLTLLYEFK